MSVTFGSTIYDDWRLPTTVYAPANMSGAYNITTSEMGHLFYTELGNLGYYDTFGYPQPGWGLNNSGDFQNLTTSGYWSGTEYGTNSYDAWGFHFGLGYQYLDGKLTPNHHYALAVRSGDVAAAASVPEPTTIALLGIGLAGMGVYGVRRRRHG